jgi:aspartokinase-like uncharacterized kinase
LDAVVKVGGSFQADREALKELCGILEEVSTEHPLLIVPGGGKFADLVRHLQRTLGLSDRTAHVMAIFGMNIFGHQLHRLIRGSKITKSTKRIGSKGCTIFLPFQELRCCEELEPSWDVTSDAIAAWASAKVGCKKLILVKMIDGIFHRRRLRTSIFAPELRRMKQSVVDRKLPEILESAGIKCWIVNGKHPERVKAVLEGREAIYTVISPGA